MQVMDIYTTVNEVMINIKGTKYDKPLLPFLNASKFTTGAKVNIYLIDFAGCVKYTNGLLFFVIRCIYDCPSVSEVVLMDTGRI